MQDILYYYDEQISIVHSKNMQVTYKEHNHANHFVIATVLNGTVLINYQQHMQNISASVFFIIPPYQLHSITLPAQYELISICLPKQLCFGDKDNICTILNQKLLKFNISSSLISHVAEKFKQKKYTEKHYMRRTIQNFELFPETDDRITTLAKNVNICKSHFINSFKADIGMTPHKFRLQNRIRKAQRLISENFSFAETAALLGFYDQSHFIKIFKEYTGITPSKYKQSLRPLYINKGQA